MKKLLSILLFLPLAMSAQKPEAVLRSWSGNGLEPDAKVRTLNIFINVIYDRHSDWNPFPENNGVWNNAQHEGINNEAIPSYLSDTTFMNTVYDPERLTGCITRVFGESSFDSLQLTGDFVVVNINESRIEDGRDHHGYYYYTDITSFSEIISAAIRFMDSCGGLKTLYGHDMGWQYGFSKGQKSSSIMLDGCAPFIQFFFRNLTRSSGPWIQGRGTASAFLGTPLPCVTQYSLFAVLELSSMWATRTSAKILQVLSAMKFPTSYLAGTASIPQAETTAERRRGCLSLPSREATG
ncbi:MAG: hypothetical protein IKN37_07080 [Bacteroidales bacterium]|nr:hypothetical protein [Bacteroidales bacterium]